MLGTEPRTQSLTSVQPFSYVSCKPRDRYRCKQKAEGLGGHDPHTTQHATWYLGTQVREEEGSPQRATGKSYKEEQGSSLLVRGPSWQSGRTQEGQALGTAGLKFLLQSLILRGRERTGLCFGDSTSDLWGGKKTREKKQAERPSVAGTDIRAE